MDAANIPFSPVSTPSDLFDDPQLNAHGRMLETRMANGRIVKLPSMPFTIDGEAPKMRLPAALQRRAYRCRDGAVRLLARTDCQIAAGKNNRVMRPQPNQSGILIIMYGAAGFASGPSGPATRCFVGGKVFR